MATRKKGSASRKRTMKKAKKPAKKKKPMHKKPKKHTKKKAARRIKKVKKAVKKKLKLRKKAKPKKALVKKVEKAKKKVIKIKRTITVSKAAKPNANAVKKPEIDKKEIEEMKKITRILSDAYVRQLLIDVGGENALAIVRNFYGSYSDEEIAKKLKLKISDVRATLNRLHNEGLVRYIRDKDSQTGWYSYSWSLNRERMDEWVSKQCDKKHSLAHGNGKEYYFCPSCGMGSVMEFGKACDCMFRCEKCNKALEFMDEVKLEEIAVAAPARR